VGGAGGAVSLGRTYCSFATSTISQCSTGAGGTGGSGGASSGNGGVGGAGGEGGGLAIVLGNGSNNQFTTVTSATITHCTTGAGAAGGSPGVGGGTVGAAGIMGSGGCLYSATTGSGFSKFSNCIIADDGGGSLVADLGGFLASNGFNLIGNGTGASFTPLPTDLVGSTSSPLLALLGPLGNHGGPTSTCLILPGSLALDSGNPSQLEPDQRGLSRPRGAGVDRGAVEMGTPTPVELWRHSLAQSYASTDTVADEADFDGDGVPNLIELACGTDPQTPATGLRALTYEGDLSGGGLIISRGIPVTIANPTGGVCALFIRRSDHSSSGIVYESLFSADLASWEAPGVTTTVLADDNTHQVVRVDFPALLTGGTTPRFFALKVTSSP